MSNKIAIVTGCSGFIGSSFTERLLSEDWYVYGIDKLTYVANIKHTNYLIETYKQFKFVQADITTIDWLPECDVIFNFAAESDVDNSTFNDASFVTSNIGGVQNLLNLINKKLLLRSDRPLFFHISTDEVYGDASWTPNNEHSPLNPSNPYSATKAAADLLIQSWHRTHQLEYIIVRPSNNYGVRQYPEKLIPLTVKRLSRNKKIKLHNQGTPLRTWTHVEDTINAIQLIYQQGVRNSVYNISSEFEQTNLETVKQIVEAYGYDGEIENILDLSYNRPGQDIRYQISCIPLKALGWKPTRDFSSHIKSLVNYYKREFTW
jgi:dTDP-glucose 4,6-dehydratase